MFDDLYLWGVLAIILFFITVLLIFAITNHIFPFVLDFCIKSRFCKEARSFRHLKIAFLLIFVLIAFDFMLLFTSISSAYYSVINTLLILDFYYVSGFMLWYIMRYVENKYITEEGKITKESVHSSRNFLFIIFSFIIVLLLSLIWDINILDFLSDIVFMISANKYLSGLAVFIVFLMLSSVILYLFKTYLNSVVRKTDTPYDDLIVGKIEYPISWVVIFIGGALALKKMEYDNSILLSIIYTSIIVVVMHTINIIIDNIIDYWEKTVQKHTRQERVDEVVFVVAHNTSKILIVFISVIMILSAWGLAQELKGVLLSLSVVGVIMGFALKETFSNIISGIALMTDHAFKKGDLILLESGEKGYVTKIGLRSTKIRTFDYEVITVPNSYLGNSKVLNYAQPTNMVRIVMDVGVAYGSDSDLVEKVLLGVLKKKEFIADHDKSGVWFLEFGDYALKFKLIFYVNDYHKRFSIMTEINRDIYKALKNNNINIPFPTRTHYTWDMGKKKPKAKLPVEIDEKTKQPSRKKIGSRPTKKTKIKKAKASSISVSAKKKITKRTTKKDGKRNIKGNKRRAAKKLK